MIKNTRPSFPKPTPTSIFFVFESFKQNFHPDVKRGSSRNHRCLFWLVGTASVFILTFCLAVKFFLLAVFLMDCVCIIQCTQKHEIHNAVYLQYARGETLYDFPFYFYVYLWEYTDRFVNTLSTAELWKAERLAIISFVFKLKIPTLIVLEALHTIQKLKSQIKPALKI